MVHKLAIVAVIGLTVSAVCMGAGGAMDGSDFGKGFRSAWTCPCSSDRPRCENGGGYPTSRDPGLGRQRPCQPHHSRPCHLCPGQRRPAACQRQSGAGSACARARRQGRAGLPHGWSTARDNLDRHPARPGVQEIRHRRQRQSGAAQPEPGPGQAVHRRLAARSRPTARWSIPNSISPAPATSISPMWRRACRKCISPAAATPTSRPPRKPTSMSPDRATSTCTPIPRSWKPISPGSGRIHNIAAGG